MCLVLQDERLRQSTGREEWMTSLPAIGLAQDIGLTARSFRSKGPAQQDNSWTKTPGGDAKSKVRLILLPSLSVELVNLDEFRMTDFFVTS
mgnify:FL=1